MVAARRLASSDDAREATQETMARLIERVRAGRVATADELAPIAYGIARHVITDMLRSRRPAESAVLDELAAAGPDALEALISRENRELVSRAVSALSRAERDLLRRCVVDGATVEAIAAELGERADRVRKRKSRALRRLGELVRTFEGGASPSPRP